MILHCSYRIVSSSFYETIPKAVTLTFTLVSNGVLYQLELKEKVMLTR